MNPILNLTVLLLIGASVSEAYRHSAQLVETTEQQQIEQQGPDAVEQQQTTTVYAPAPAAYQFAYSTGDTGAYSGQLTEDARHFRQESRDEFGNVVGKYGYVDPYGKLRVVNYRAGADGYHASGDVGPDQEVLQQQQQLYASDLATQLQAQAWQKYGQTNLYGFDASTVHPARYTEWTSVNAGNTGSYSGQLIGAQGKTTARLVAPQTVYYTTSHVRSPVAALRQHRTSNQQWNKQSVHHSGSYTAQPAAKVVQATSYHTSTQHVAPLVIHPAPVKQHITTTTSAKLVDDSAYQKTTTYHGHSGAFRSPAARLTELNSHGSTSSSSSSSASGYGATKTYGTLKTLTPVVRVARYFAPTVGQAHAVVNFQQGGPQPYKYSYQF